MKNYVVTLRNRSRRERRVIVKQCASESAACRTAELLDRMNGTYQPWDPYQAILAYESKNPVIA